MAASATTPKLFQPARIGSLPLRHRIVMAPLTRTRADEHHVPGPLAKEYYTQRSSSPGTLIISEGTIISPEAGGWTHAPGIWSDAQIKRWREITDSVHAAGSFIYMQIFAMGRAADPSVLQKEGGFDVVGPSPIAIQGLNTPRELSVAEIKEYIEAFKYAAVNAVNKAGFDGVEVHCANGYLLDQFLQDAANERVDEYGGSIENRARFTLEVLHAVSKAIGEAKTGLRISPWADFQDVGMADPIPTFTYLVKEVQKCFPALAFLHVIEPRVNGASTREMVDASHSNAFIRDLWEPRPLILAGAFDRQIAIAAAEEKEGTFVAFGRAFLANPDLPLRLCQDVPLTKPNRETFYLAGNFTPLGYTDYPFAAEVGRAC